MAVKALPFIKKYFTPSQLRWIKCFCVYFTYPKVMWGTAITFKTALKLCQGIGYIFFIG